MPFLYCFTSSAQWPFFNLTQFSLNVIGNTVHGTKVQLKSKNMTVTHQAKRMIRGQMVKIQVLLDLRPFLYHKVPYTIPHFQGILPEIPRWRVPPVTLWAATIPSVGCSTHPSIACTRMHLNSKGQQSIQIESDHQQQWN